MAKLRDYNIPLKDVSNEGNLFEFQLDDTFFSMLESAEIEHGEIDAKVTLTKKLSFFHLDFELEGSVEVICDRCLDNMDLPLSIEENVQLKLGLEYSEEEDYIIVPDTERQINIAWLMYEFIALNIPIKHIHDENDCNKEMIARLSNHITYEVTDEEKRDNAQISNKPEELKNDPRWDRLKDILENN